MSHLPKFFLITNLYGLLIYNYYYSFSNKTFTDNYYLYSIKPGMYPIWKDLMKTKK